MAGLEHSAFISRLDYVLEEKKTSRRGLAASIGVSQPGLNAYWTRQSEPPRPTLIAIANALGVHLLWLATGEGPIWLDTPPRSSNRPPLVSFDTSALTISMRQLDLIEKEAGRKLGPDARAAAIAGLYLALMKDRADGQPDPAVE